MRDRTIALIVLGTIFVVLLICLRLRAEAPPTGWTTSGRIVRVLDGDTIEMEVVKRIRVRLLDCWAPETRGDERDSGMVSRQYLHDMAHQQPAILHVPTVGSRHVGEATSMGRVLGIVWLAGDRHSLSDRMIESGHAWGTKKELTDSLSLAP